MSERFHRFGSRALLLVLWFGAGYYLVFGGMYSVFDIDELSDRRDATISRIDSLIARTDSLVHRGDSLASEPAAIERVAREELGLIRDGELLIRFRTRADSGESGTLDD